MRQVMRGGDEGGRLLKGVMRPLVAVAGAAVSTAAGMSAVWALGTRAASFRHRVSYARARRGRA